MYTRQTGQLAEDIALDYLIGQGLTKVATNYHCRYGEIDLVMRDSDTLVFVEVRYRASRHYASGDYGGGILSVNRRKQQKLIRTATHYLQHFAHINDNARIDVLALSDLEGSANAIHWIKNAIEGG